MPAFLIYALIFIKYKCIYFFGGFLGWALESLWTPRNISLDHEISHLTIFLCKISRERPRGPGLVRRSGMGEEQFCSWLAVTLRLRFPGTLLHASGNWRLTLSFSLPSSQMLLSKLVFKEKNNDMVKACKNILRPIKFQKWSRPVLYPFLLLTHDHLQLRGRVLCCRSRVVSSTFVQLYICCPPAIQCTPLDLLQVWLWVHLHNCLRSYRNWDPGRFL